MKKQNKYKISEYLKEWNDFFNWQLFNSSWIDIADVYKNYINKSNNWLFKNIWSEFEHLLNTTSHLAD